MSDVTIVYWRDIPAQVIVGRGRGSAKVQLSERFEQAIDRAAMTAGLAGTDDYLGEWRRVPGEAGGDDPREAAEATAAQLEAEYDRDRLATLARNGGRQPGEPT